MDYYKALQLQAMRAVVQTDGEAFMRHVRRFYSKTFHVPLPDVEDLPEEQVLMAYYEECFEAMTDAERHEHLEELLETDEEREDREAKEKVASVVDEKFAEALNAEVKSGARREIPKERHVLPKLAAPADPLERARAIKAAISNGLKPPAEAPETPAPPPIHMTFDGGNLQDIPPEFAEMDPIGPTPSGK